MFEGSERPPEGEAQPQGPNNEQPASNESFGGRELRPYKIMPLPGSTWLFDIQPKVSNYKPPVDEKAFVGFINGKMSYLGKLSLGDTQAGLEISKERESCVEVL